MLSPADLTKFRSFIQACEVDHNLLHLPELKFFRDYLEKLGATLPPAPTKAAPTSANGTAHAEPEQKPATPPAEPEPEPEPESEESEVELDNSGVIDRDDGEMPAMGDMTKEVTDEDREKAMEKRSEAQSAFSEGELEKAVELYSEAITFNPASAMFYAKRAACLLKLQRPCAAVRDCDQAIELNPDSAAAYKFRGRAHRLLGEWVEAASDLRTACKLDFDEQSDEWLKEVTPNAQKLEEHGRRCERRRQEREVRERRERVRKAREEHARVREQQQQGADNDEMGGEGMPGGMPAGMAGLFSDPDIMTAMQDPEVMAAFADVSKNPANIMKYQGNPKIMALIAKMSGKMGGGAGGMPGMGGMGGMPGMPGGMGGFPGGMDGAGAGQPPKKAPDMDVD